MKKAVKDDINPRYIGSGTVTLLKLSSLLDPRFKSKYIEESSLEEIKDKVISEMSAFRPQQQPILASPDTEKPAKKKKQLWEVFFKDNEVQDEDATLLLLSPGQKVQREIETYLSTPRIDMEADPLAWWRHNCKVFPLLSKLRSKEVLICMCNEFSF